MKHFLKYCLLLFILLQDSGSLLARNDNVLLSDTKREEIQRYFGYEILPYRYLTLPFDVSVNSNETGVFVDIGCVYFIFLPLFILLYFTKRKLLLSFFSISMIGEHFKDFALDSSGWISLNKTPICSQQLKSRVIN